MVQSIELLFDEGTEAALREGWTRLHAAGLPSLATNHSPSNRPHLTIAVADGGLERACDAVRAALADTALDGDGLATALGGVVLFGGHRHRFVLARSVVLSRPLQALHSAVHQAIDGAAPGLDVVENSRPDAWTPHTTLARRVPAERLGDTLSLLDLATRDCRLVAARLWDSGPRTVTRLG